jgi:2-phosphoglycerate kinase
MDGFDMTEISIRKINSLIPKGFIVFISGVTGTGKSTLSNDILRYFNSFRVIEETDLIRETIRGYSELIYQSLNEFEIDKIKLLQVTGHTKLLNYNELTNQCSLMRHSIEKIVERQQRRGIPSIINGVHLVPETLDGILKNKNVIYINLYINDPNKIYERLSKRDPGSFVLNNIPLLYETNVALYESISRLSDLYNGLFNNIDVTHLSKKEVFSTAITYISELLLCGLN